MPLDYTAPHTPVYARNPASKSVLLNGAMEGHVLVKNINRSLPLKSPRLLSIFGYDAVTPSKMDIASPADFLSPFTFGYESQLGYNGFVTPGPSPAIAPNGTLTCGGKFSSLLKFIINICTDFGTGGSGANSQAYISAPFDALQEQAYQDGTSVFWDFSSPNPIVDAASDACLVFINAFASEGADRIGLRGLFLLLSSCF